MSSARHDVMMGAGGVYVGDNISPEMTGNRRHRWHHNQSGRKMNVV